MLRAYPRCRRLLLEAPKPFLPAPDDAEPHPVDFDLRLRDHPHPVPMPFSTGDASPGGGSPTLSPDSQARALAARYIHSDAVDLALLDDLAAAPARLNHNVRAALATLGLSASRFHIKTAKLSTDAGVSGPFVPLPVMTDGSRFASEAAQVQNALATAEDLKSILPHIPLNPPLPGDLEVTSPFGPRIDPFLGRPALHTGVDLHGAYGDAVRATAPGRVTFAGAMGGLRQSRRSRQWQRPRDSIRTSVKHRRDARRARRNWFDCRSYWR